MSSDAMKPSAPRYYVVEKSATGHCCFAASVLDRSRPFCPALGDIPESEQRDVVCECHDVEAATRIAALLNAQDKCG